MGSAQSVPPEGQALDGLSTSSRRCRGEMASGVRPAIAAAPLTAVAPRRRGEAPRTANSGSVRAVTSAIAALATRGVRPGTPAIAPAAIEPETSSASRCVFPVGSTP